MTNIWSPSTNHLGQFKDGWGEAAKGKPPTEKDTWHNLGRHCQVQFGKFAETENDTRELQEKLFLLIVNQRRLEAHAGDREGKTIPKAELTKVPKGKRPPKK